jgi:hypothetical protein
MAGRTYTYTDFGALDTTALANDVTTALRDA